MARSSSSTKKAARLAERGKGQKVRFQGGTLFPVVVAVVIVLGLALVTYARQSRPAADASAPTVNDHWHHTYGFFLCDEWVMLEGDGEARDANGQPTNIAYTRTGIHSHDDGLIHWHAFSSASVGNRAVLGVFLDTYGVDLSDDELQFPEDQRAQLPEPFQETGLIDEDSTCMVDGEEVDGQLQVTRWNNISDDDSAGTTFIAGFDRIRLDRNAMVAVIAFVPDGTDVVKPPWNEQFDENVANDTNQARPDQLFPNIQVDEDGNITGEDGEELLQDDVGPAVDDLDDVEADVEFDAVTDEDGSDGDGADDGADDEPASSDAPATTDG